jgi:hypothetical protein
LVCFRKVEPPLLLSRLNMLGCQTSCTIISWGCQFKGAKFEIEACSGDMKRRFAHG